MRFRLFCVSRHSPLKKFAPRRNSRRLPSPYRRGSASVFKSSPGPQCLGSDPRCKALLLRRAVRLVRCINALFYLFNRSCISSGLSRKFLSEYLIREKILPLVFFCISVPTRQAGGRELYFFWRGAELLSVRPCCAEFQPPKQGYNTKTRKRALHAQGRACARVYTSSHVHVVLLLIHAHLTGTGGTRRC